LFYGSDSSQLVSKAFKNEDETPVDCILLENVVSRKKQVIPKLMNALHEL
jgi:inorganic pyrophosphatase/exopolyphosphatase